VSTSPLQPRCANASSTTDTSTAQTAQRSCVTTRSTSSAASPPRPGGRDPRRPPSASLRPCRSRPPQAPPAGHWSTQCGGSAPPVASRTRRSHRPRRPRPRARRASPSPKAAATRSACPGRFPHRPRASTGRGLDADPGRPRPLSTPSAPWPGTPTRARPGPGR
jgi:hypothetical protein